MDLSRFDLLPEEEVDALIAEYYPQNRRLNRREKILYLANEFARIRGVTIPELESGVFIHNYVQEDAALAAECARRLGTNFRVTRYEAVYICAAYWEQSSIGQFRLSEQTEAFLKEALDSDEPTTMHLEWLAFRFLDEDASAVAQRRLKTRNLTFDCEFEFSSRAPVAQIRDKLRALTLINRRWARSPMLVSVDFEGEQPYVQLNSTNLKLTSLLDYLRENTTRRAALYDEMKAFINAFHYSNVSGFPVELEEMKVDVLGQIWIEKVHNIRTEFAPDYYKTTVLDNWNSSLARRSYETIEMQ